MEEKKKPRHQQQTFKSVTQAYCINQNANCCRHRLWKLGCISTAANSGSLAGPWSNLDILSLSALLLFSPSNPLSHPLRPLFIDWFSVSVYVDSDPFRPILSLKRQTKLPLKPRKYTIVTQCSVKCVIKARRQVRHYYKQRFKNLVMWTLACPCANTCIYVFGPYDTARKIIIATLIDINHRLATSSSFSVWMYKYVCMWSQI